MIDEAPVRKEAAHHPGKLARAALRAIDAGLRALQRLRHRIEPALADEEAAGAGGKRNQSRGDEPPAIAAATPPRKTLLRRFLIIVMCLLMGGVAGMLISHRGFSRLIDSQGNRIDAMQDEIKQLQQEEARSLRDKYKLQKEVAGYRNSLNEARQDVEDHKREIAELNTQLFNMREAGRLANKGRRVPAPVATQPATQPRTPGKTGTCVTGGANPGADLLDCIDKLNRQ